MFLSACHGLVLNPWFTDWQTQHAQHSALDPRTLSDPADTILSSHAGPTASTPASTDPLHPPSNPLQPSSSLGTASAAPATIAALSDGSSSSSHVQPSTSSHRAPEQQLFAGYVSYEQLENCLGPGGSERKLSLWPRLVASESQTPVQYSVRMNGPGGRGHCLVAITAGAPGPPPEAREAAANAAPAKPLTLGQRLLKARSMARSAAGALVAAAQYGHSLLDFQPYRADSITPSFVSCRRKQALAGRLRSGKLTHLLMLDRHCEGGGHVGNRRRPHHHLAAWLALALCLDDPQLARGCHCCPHPAAIVIVSEGSAAPACLSRCLTPRLMDAVNLYLIVACN